jgi:hypothetical protein
MTVYLFSLLGANCRFFKNIEEIRLKLGVIITFFAVLKN